MKLKVLLVKKLVNINGPFVKCTISNSLQFSFSNPIRLEWV
jgi:hypothetical protein